MRRFVAPHIVSVASVMAVVAHPTAPCLANATVDLSLKSPRRAFYRGEEIMLVAECVNRTDQAVPEATLTADLGGVIQMSSSVPEVPAGENRQAALRIPTAAIKSGRYELKLTLATGAKTHAALTTPMTIAMRPNPHRLIVWLWGGGGNKWYAEHGFTSWSGAYWSAVGESRVDATRRALDQGLLHGGDVGLSANGGLRDLISHTFDDPDALYVGLEDWYVKRVKEGKYKPLPNPFHPEVARVQNEANRRLMEVAKDYPQVRTAFFNTEVVDTMEVNRNEAGLRLMKEKLGSTDETFGEPKFVAPGVIADDDPKYLYRKYAYQHGKGVTEANRRTAEMIDRYRPDILTISDPYREAALFDLYPGLDVIETWTYTNPDPKLMLYIETLRAACKPTGQIPLNVVTMLNYPGQLDPSELWMLMGPGRVAVTSWINLSRAPRIVGYYYSSECPPNHKDHYKVPRETSLKIKELAEAVYRPYGPMITQLDAAPRRIAVLSSESSRVHGKSPQLRGGYNNMQIYHFYTVMAMAHLQADVVFDETIERYGLNDYDVLVMPKCDVLTKSVFDEVLRFRKRGGTIIADQYLGPGIPGVIRFDFDFTYRNKVSAKAIVENKAYAEWNDQLQPDSAELETVKGITALDDQKLMESYAARLEQGLAGKVEPDVECDKPTVLVNTLEKHGVKYLVIVNDKRTYDDRVGKYKSVLGKLLPQTATIRLRKWDSPQLHAYDMLERKPVVLKRVNAGYEFTIDLTELGGKIVALYPRKIGRINFQAPNAMPRGETRYIRVIMVDEWGGPLPGLQPIELELRSPSGERSDFSDYYCATRGVFDFSFTAARNDTPGKWTIIVRDLTSGLTAQRSVAVAD